LLPDGVPEFRPEMVASLPPTKKRIIEHMLEAGPSSWTLSAQELGEAVGTSGVNVTRTAQALGYGKLAHLRLALADYVTAQQTNGSARPQSGLLSALAEVPSNELLVRDVQVAHDGLEALLKRVPVEQFNRAVGLLDRSACIVWRGVGPSGYLAEYAALHCHRLGHSSKAMTQMGRALADELLELDRKDILVLLSYGATERQTEAIVSEAKSKGCDIILITDDAAKALTDQVTMVLECRRGVRDQFQSHAVTMVLIETLILGVAKRNIRRGARSMTKLRALRNSIGE